MLSTITTKINVVWASGGTVDTPVLGTGLARGGSSSLLSPTIKLGTLMDTFLTEWIRKVVKGVLVVLSFRHYVSLRNYRYTFNHITGGNYNCYYSSFFKNLTFALVRWSRIQTYQNQRIHTQVINKNRRMFTLCPTY